MPIWVAVFIVGAVILTVGLVWVTLHQVNKPEIVVYDHTASAPYIYEYGAIEISGATAPGKPDQAEGKEATVATHRTALVIDASTPSSSFKERVNRLLESLNGSNIKVDVYSYAPKTASAVVSGPPSWETSEVESSDFASAVQEVASKGYVQILTSQPA